MIDRCRSLTRAKSLCTRADGGPMTRRRLKETGEELEMLKLPESKRPRKSMVTSQPKRANSVVTTAREESEVETVEQDGAAPPKLPKLNIYTRRARARPEERRPTHSLADVCFKPFRLPGEPLSPSLSQPHPCQHPLQEPSSPGIYPPPPLARNPIARRSPSPYEEVIVPARQWSQAPRARSASVKAPTSAQKRKARSRQPSRAPRSRSSSSEYIPSTRSRCASKTYNTRSRQASRAPESARPATQLSSELLASALRNQGRKRYTSAQSEDSTSSSELIKKRKLSEVPREKAPPAKKRGRPRKEKSLAPLPLPQEVDYFEAESSSQKEEVNRKRRTAPKQRPSQSAATSTATPRRRGRPPKSESQKSAEAAAKAAQNALATATPSSRTAAGRGRRVASTPRPTRILPQRVAARSTRRRGAAPESDNVAAIPRAGTIFTSTPVQTETPASNQGLIDVQATDTMENAFLNVTESDHQVEVNAAGFEESFEDIDTNEEECVEEVVAHLEEDPHNSGPIQEASHDSGHIDAQPPLESGTNSRCKDVQFESMRSGGSSPTSHIENVDPVIDESLSSFDKTVDPTENEMSSDSSEEPHQDVSGGLLGEPSLSRRVSAETPERSTDTTSTNDSGLDSSPINDVDSNSDSESAEGCMENDEREASLDNIVNADESVKPLPPKSEPTFDSSNEVAEDTDSDSDELRAEDRFVENGLASGNSSASSESVTATAEISLELEKPRSVAWTESGTGTRSRSSSRGSKGNKGLEEIVQGLYRCHELMMKKALTERTALTVKVTAPKDKEEKYATNVIVPSKNVYRVDTLDGAGPYVAPWSRGIFMSASMPGPSGISKTSAWVPNHSCSVESAKKSAITVESMTKSANQINTGVEEPLNLVLKVPSNLAQSQDSVAPLSLVSPGSMKSNLLDTCKLPPRLREKARNKLIRLTSTESAKCATEAGTSNESSTQSSGNSMPQGPATGSAVVPTSPPLAPKSITDYATLPTIPKLNSSSSHKLLHDHEIDLPTDFEVAGPSARMTRSSNEGSKSDTDKEYPGPSCSGLSTSRKSSVMKTRRSVASPTDLDLPNVDESPRKVSKKLVITVAPRPTQPQQNEVAEPKPSTSGTSGKNTFSSTRTAKQPTSADVNQPRVPPIIIRAAPSHSSPTNPPGYVICESKSGTSSSSNAPVAGANARPVSSQPSTSAATPPSRPQAGPSHRVPQAPIPAPSSVVAVPGTVITAPAPASAPDVGRILRPQPPSVVVAAADSTQPEQPRRPREAR